MRTSSMTAKWWASTARRETLTWPVWPMRGDSVTRSSSRLGLACCTVCLCYVLVRLHCTTIEYSVLVQYMALIDVLQVNVCLYMHVQYTCTVGVSLAFFFSVGLQ